MAGPFVRENRGISWKDQTLNSISPPPLPLVAFSGLVITLLYLAYSSGRQERVERRRSDLRFGLILLPMAVVLAVNVVALRRRVARYVLGVPPVAAEAVAEDGGSVVGLLLVLVLVLVMVHYQSSVQSGWFRMF
ncbi:transmembrane gamma-carboxyglutamic acid protein [Striga asiatica]|uniref:Transmembrane gamma-carboxyglutamic acid protein n=1 Tax=Striga asiatica TaxID=4170 RepID=A0A5A7QLK8_STRAF|nr:transmembrane gamma-carboxyglutamic acid protein [Striga asiatica]